MRREYVGFSVRKDTRRKAKQWQGILRYAEDNPNYLEPPNEGKDTRTPEQRRKKVFRQKTTTLDVEPSKWSNPERAYEDEHARAIAALMDYRDRLEAEEESAARARVLPTANMTVGEYVNAFIDDKEASGNVERNTVGGYRTTAKKLAQAFPNVTMAELTRTMVQKWENSLSMNGVAPATVIKYHRLLSMVCDDAIAKDELIKNPCKGVKLPKRTAPSPNSLTEDDYNRLDAALSMMQPSPTVTAAIIALHTGMREGEVCGLRWRCYDRERGVITVEESIGKAPGGTYSKAPKTNSSRRNIPVTRQLAQALERRRVAMVQELETGNVTLTPAEFGERYIIGYVDGRYYSPTLIGRGWHELSKAFGLTGTQGRPITFHDLRHSFATRAIAKGIDVRTVSAILGHASTSITLDVYADADPENKRRAMEQLSQALLDAGTVEPLSILVEPETVEE